MVLPVAGIIWDPREPLPPGHPLHWQGTSSSHLAPTMAAGSPWHPELEPQSTPRAPQNVLPPLSSSLIAHVVHDTAKVSITQLFQNSTNDTIQKGAYTFP